MVPVQDEVLQVDFDHAKARLRVTGLLVFDDHDIADSLTFGLGLPGDLGFPYPQISPVFPPRATASFNVKWDGTIDTAQIHNTAQQFEDCSLRLARPLGGPVSNLALCFSRKPPIRRETWLLF